MKQELKYLEVNYSEKDLAYSVYCYFGKKFRN